MSDPNERSPVNVRASSRTIRSYRTALTATLACLAWLACSPSTDASKGLISGREPTGERARTARPFLRVTLRQANPSNVYFFQLALDSTFQEPIESGDVKPESTLIAWQPPENLEVGRPYYWRVGWMSGERVVWDTVQSFLGGPPLSAFPNPYCCKWAKSHKTITIDGMAPPARIQIMTGTGELVFASEALSQPSYAWPITDNSGAAVANGSYRVVVEDRLGRHDLALRIVRPD